MQVGTEGGGGAGDSYRTLLSSSYPTAHGQSFKNPTRLSDRSNNLSANKDFFRFLSWSLVAMSCIVNTV